jgi:hypothetical protein
MTLQIAQFALCHPTVDWTLITSRPDGKLNHSRLDVLDCNHRGDSTIWLAIKQGAPISRMGQYIRAWLSRLAAWLFGQVQLKLEPGAAVLRSDQVKTNHQGNHYQKARSNSEPWHGDTGRPGPPPKKTAESDRLLDSKRLYRGLLHRTGERAQLDIDLGIVSQLRPAYRTLLDVFPGLSW